MCYGKPLYSGQTKQIEAHTKVNLHYLHRDYRILKSNLWDHVDIILKRNDPDKERLINLDTVNKFVQQLRLLF